MDGIAAARSRESWADCPCRIYVLDARGNIAQPIGCKTPRARERSCAQAAGEGFAVSHKGILAVQAGFTVFADGRRRIDDPIATAGSTPGGPGRHEHQEEAIHLPPRRASFCAGVSTEVGVVKKPFVWRPAPACTPF